MNLFEKSNELLKMSKTEIIDVSLFENKKICLIGGGKIEEDIDYSEYDILIGMNQIYKSNIYEHINIMFHGMSVFDMEFVKNIEFYKKNKTIIFLPNLSESYTVNRLYNEKNVINKCINLGCVFNISYCLKVCKLMKSSPFMGIMILNLMTEFSYKSIDIYGFNFYEKENNDYYEIKNNYMNGHNIINNKDYFMKLLNENKNMNWINL